MPKTGPSEKKSVGHIQQRRPQSPKFEQVSRRLPDQSMPEREAAAEGNKFHAILGAMQDGITIRDLDYNLTYQNHVTIDMFGDRTGEKCYRVFQGLDRICDGCPVELALQDGQTHTSVKEVVLPSGEVSYWENTANPIRDADGEIVACLEINKNITEHKRRDAELLLQKQRLEDVTNSVGCGLMLLDRETRIRCANSLAQEWFGSLEQIKGKCCCEIFTMGRSRCAAWTLLETGQTAQGEVFEAVIDGEQRFFYTVASSAKDTDGKIGQITLAVIDVTELKRTEALLARERDNLNALMENMPDSIYFKDVKSRFTKINDAHAKLLGLDNTGEAVGKTDCDFFSPDVAQSCLEDEQNIVESGWPVVGKIEEVKTADGKKSHWFSATKVPISDESGRVAGIVGISRDITEQKKVEDKLKESETAFRNLFDNTLLGLYRTTPDGRVLMANPAILRMLGYESFDELAQRNLEEGGFEAEYPRSLFKQRIETDGEIVGLESAWTRHDGTTLFVRESAKAVRDEAGKTLYYEGTVEDITERKTAEEQLLYRLAFEHLIMGISAKFMHLAPHEIDAGIQETIESVGKFARVDRAYVFQFREDDRLADNTHEWCATDVEPQIHNLQGIVISDELPWFFSRIRTENVFHVSSVEQLPAEARLEKEHLQMQDVQSLIVIPMRNGDRLTGFIGFDSVRSEEEWPQDVIDLLKITGQVISTTLERNKAEIALQNSERKYRLLADNATDIVWTANLDLQLTYVSPSVERVRGYSVEEATAQTFEEIVTPSSIEQARQLLAEGLAEEGGPNGDRSRVWTVELQVTRKDGPPIWTESTVALIRDESGVPIGIRGSSRDITERKKAEDELRRQEERLELFFNQSLDGFFFMMLDEPVQWDDSVDKEEVLDHVFEHQRITKVNDAMLEQYGAPKEHFIGMTPKDFYAHDIDYGKDIWKRFFDSGRLHIETEERKLDGTPVWIEGDYICLYDAEGRITGHFGIQRDITERKKALEEIEQSERRYRELFENMTSGVAVYEVVDDGKDFVFKDFNRAGEAIDHTERADLIGKRVTEVFPGVENFGLFEVFKRVYQTGEPEFCPQGFHQDEKISGWRENRVYKLPTGEIVAIYNDITERKQIEEELRLDESRFEALLKLSQMTETPVEELADFALSQAVKLTKSAIGFIGFLDEEETVMKIHAWSKEAMAQCAMKDKPLGFLLDKAGIWADVVRLGKAVIVNDYAGDNPSKKGYPEGHVELVRVMVVPIFDGNRVAAIMAVANKQGDYEQADVRQLTLLGDGIWKSAQRVKAESELRASEEKHRFLFEAVPVGIGISDFEGNILACNRATEEMMGYSVDELQSINVKDTYASPELRAALIEDVKKTGKVRNWEHEIETKDGSIRSLLINVDVIERDGQKVLLTTSRDITEIKKAEMELRVKDSTLASAINGIGITTVDGKLIYVNDALVKMWGYDNEEEILGRSLPEFWEGDGVFETIRALREKGSKIGEDIGKRKDGSLFDVEFSASMIKDNDGNPMYMFGSFLDISKRKESEELLHQMALLPKLNPSPVLRFDSNGAVLLSNEAAVEILGEAVRKGRRLKDVLPGLSHINLKSCIDQGQVLTEEVRVKDRYYQFAIRGIADLGLAQAYGSDITKRKKAEDALKKTHGELEGRVFQRTMELAGTNQELKSEIAERRSAEKALAQELETSRHRQAEVSALLRGSRVVLEHHSFEDAARKLFDYCKELTGATSGYVALLRKDNMENEVVFLDSGKMTCSVDLSLPMPIRGLREVVYRKGEPAYDNNFAESKWMKLMPGGHVRLENVLFAPMKIKGEAAGLLGLGNKPGGFDETDAKMAGAFAELAAVALKNSRTLGALRQSQEELSKARDHFEELVQERTAELTKTNQRLEKQIARRRKAGQELEDKQKQLKTLTSELALAEERERRRIAVGIHDNIGQKMALAKLELQSSMTSSDDSKMTESLESVCDRIDEAIRETHSLTFELSNPALYELSFDAAIEQWLFEQIQKKQDIRCDVTANVEPVELGINLKVVLFQAIRELAVNVVKYANATSLSVKIDKGKKRVVVSVADDGSGFVPSEMRASTSNDKGGFGLFNIRERLEHMGGGMKIESAPKKGTIITLTVPLDQQ